MLCYEDLTLLARARLKVAKVLRRTYDMLLDGQHTGRYRWDQLLKTEKTHFGTLVEINLQRAFGFLVITFRPSRGQAVVSSLSIAPLEHH